MESIAANMEVNGICIKCQACVRKCPQHAKFFDDAQFLSHVRMLERDYTRRAENYIIEINNSVSKADASAFGIFEKSDL